MVPGALPGDEGLLREDWLRIRDAQDALWGEPWTRVAGGCEFAVRLAIPDDPAEPVVVTSGWCVMCAVPLLPEVPHAITKEGSRVRVEAAGYPLRVMFEAFAVHLDDDGQIGLAALFRREAALLALGGYGPPTLLAAGFSPGEPRR